MGKFFSFISNTLFALAILCLIPFTTSAQFSSLTNETLVNTTTSGMQSGYYWSLRTVAVQPDGGYIIVWIDYSGSDGQGAGIYGQRFNANGTNAGSEFLVNTSTSGDQFSPSIAVAPDGQFIVAWEGPGSSLDIFAQRFDKNGVKIRNEFLLNTSVSGNQRFPEIQFYPDGTYVAAYIDATGGQTILQRFDVDDRTIGVETRISSALGSVVLDGLCVRQDNSVLLFWTTSADVYGQIFDANLNAVGSAKMINTYTTGTQQYSLGRADAAGNMVIVWESAGQDGSGNGVYGRRYDNNFNAIGGEFAITTNTTGDQFGSSVAVEPSGRFIITWTENNNRDGGGGSPDLAGPGSSVWMREYNANGTAVGSETMINQSVTGYQGYPLIDVNASGKFVVSWEGNGTQAGNIDNFGILARSYQLSQTGTTAALSVSPTSTIANDIVTVTMTLTAPSNIANVIPNQLTVSGTNNVFATYISGPSPASATVGTSGTTFTWTYRITAEENSGTLSFGGNARTTGGVIFPYNTSNTITVKPSIFLTDMTAPNLINDANNPNSGPKVFTIGARVTNGGLTALSSVNIYLGNGVTPGTFPTTTMTLAQTNNTYQGTFALTPMAGTSDCSRSLVSLGAAKNVIAGAIDFNGDGVVNSSDDGTLSNGKKVIDGYVDVNLSGNITSTDDYTRPPGQFTGYREPSIIDGFVDTNNDGVISTADNGTYGGESKVVYWQVLYSVLDAYGQPTFGNGSDFSDDLRYKWNVWVSGNDGITTRTDVITEFAKVRQELSAASNKIIPSGGFISAILPRIIAGAVDINSDGIITNADDGTYYGKPIIDGKFDMNNSGTITTADDGVLNTVFQVIDGFVDVDNNGIINSSDAGIITVPGQTISVTFNNATFGSVGAGFDENRDNLFDYDMWHQPIGSTSWDARFLRLVDIKSFVTGSGGSNPLNGITNFYDNEPYLSRLAGDVSGTFDITYTYTFLVLKHGANYLTPYQEAASGTNNEKYNNDFPTTGIEILTMPRLILPSTGFVASSKLNQSTANVEWKTESEINTDFFIVERSVDAVNFSMINTTKAAGTSSSIRYYSYADDISSLINVKTIYYRVKLVDLDGRITYSNITSVNLKNEIGLQVWPNPFISKVLISINTQESEKINMSLFDMQGKLIRQYKTKAVKGINNLELNSLENLPIGIYNLRVESETGIKSFKLKKD
jgi:Secretion system C-terminal sorting domain